MATLVLTAVGTAIGGPIGGAIGAVLGQAVDRNVLLKPKGRQGPRLTELAIQTSSYGTQIPKQFGVMRVAGSVIWATDLIEHRSTSRSGKGQPSVTSYSYSASFAVALSARPIETVRRIWADGKLLRGAAGDWKASVRFRLHPGDEDQPVDPLIASAEGIGVTPAHRGIAYAVFEDLALADFGNRLPSLTFEVVADSAPASIGWIAETISEGEVRAGAGLPSVDGFSAYGDSARGVIETLGEAGCGWFAPVGDVIEMRATATSVTSVDDDSAAASARSRTIRPIETVPRTIAVSYYDPVRDYQTGTQRASRPAPGIRVESVEVPAAIDAGAARTIATALLARAEAARVRRRITGDTAMLGVAPGDVVTIAGEGGSWRVATATLEGMAVSLDLVPLEEASLPLFASAGRASGAPDEIAGATILHAFETPPLDDVSLSEPRLTIVAAGAAPGWRRAALRYSLDGGASWLPAGGTAMPGVIGSLVFALAMAPATLRDRANMIEVDLANSSMALADGDVAAIDRGGNLALIGDELLQFADAEQIGPTRWRLSGLSRGWRGTLPAAHPAGARFILLENDAATVLSVPAAPGQVVLVRAYGVGDPEAGVETAATISGVSILPPAPVRLSRTPRDDGGVDLRWRRRSRIDWRWRNGIEVSLGEEAERYRIEVASSLGIRVIEATDPYLTLSASEPGDVTTITVRQIGSNGTSPPATIII